jgi:ribonuclease HII
VTEPARKRRLARERERRRLVRLHVYENAGFARGFQLIGGVDEVGGSLMLAGLNDSKKVRPELRRELADSIKARAVAWAIGEASVAEIERLNIYHASLLAMERAIAALSHAPDYLLTDAVRVRSFGGEQLPVIKGDAKCATVAAASILAKVYRDALLVDLDRVHPEYGFAEHKGYATARHIAALERHGPCPHHRRSFFRVAGMLALFDLEG